MKVDHSKSEGRVGKSWCVCLLFNGSKTSVFKFKSGGQICKVEFMLYVFYPKGLYKLLGGRERERERAFGVRSFQNFQEMRPFMN